MKVYTIEDLKSFDRNDIGFLMCPSGDYTQIKKFDNNCWFGPASKFSDNCIFGEWCGFFQECSFGDMCEFSNCCIFDELCDFGKKCSFGDDCSFGDSCRFDKECDFGKTCRFKKKCEFGESCSFSKECSFSQGCILENNIKFEGIQDNVIRVLKIDNVGSWEGCHFFKTASEIYVRCDVLSECFFGTIAEFEEKVNETCKEYQQHLKKYIEAIKYAKAVM